MPDRKSALVHIGVGKTGTTAIQNALGDLARRRALQGVGVPSVGGHDQVYLSAAYQRLDRLPRAMRRVIGPDPDRLRRTLRAGWIASIRQRSSIVVSSEFLALFSDEEVSAFRRDLAAAGYENLRCLVYVREPAGLYLSGVQQNLKASAAFMHPARFRTRYRERLERWQSLFDPNLTVRHFNAKALVDGDAVTDFLTQFATFFGVDRPEAHHARQNESISAESMVLLQKYRRHVHPGQDDQFLPDSNRLLDMILAIEPEMTRPVTPPRLRDGIKRIVFSQAADDVAYLSSKFGIDMSIEPAASVPDVAPTSDVASILQSYDPAALDELYGRLLSALLKTPPG